MNVAYIMHLSPVEGKVNGKGYTPSYSILTYTPILKIVVTPEVTVNNNCKGFLYTKWVSIIYKYYRI